MVNRNLRWSLGVIFALVFLLPVCAHGVTPGAMPTPTPTEGIHGPPLCGNGIVEHGEACDDGNLVNGDGCSSDCQIELVYSYRFAPADLNFGLGQAVSGHITLAQSGFTGAVKQFALEPSGNSHDGVVCVRAIVPPDQRYGPGNVGTGGFQRMPGSINILTVRLFVQEWMDPFGPGGSQPDVGADGEPCTDDDPGLAQTGGFEEELNLSIPPCVGDANGDHRVTVDELVQAVDNGLNGCPAGPP